MSNEYPPTDRRTNSVSSGRGETQAQPYQITGLMVLGFMIAFFAIIVGVNVFMAHAAISTFGGVETASSYHAGKCSKATSPWPGRRMRSIGRLTPS
jgi:FixH